MNIYKQIYKEIKENDKILITTHIRADGDCVGSAIGLREIIKSTFPNKTVKATFEHVDYLEFLGEPDKVDDSDFIDSLVISVDNASLKRANDQRLGTASNIIKIDHHPNREPFGKIMLVEENKSSCAEIIFDLFYNFKKSAITKKGLEALFTGMVTDTGRFRYSSVDGRTFEKIAFMYDMGIDTEDILNKLDEVSFEELRFKGYVLQNMQKTENGVVYIKVTPALRDEYNVKYDEASNMVNSMSGIVGSSIWVLFNEYKEDEIRCRVRSTGIAINHVCEKYGGGGHENASGIVVKDYETVENILVDLDNLLKK